MLAALTPGGLALRGAGAFAAFQPRIGAPARQRNVLSRRGLRLPAERHLPDGHGAARLRTQPQQFLLDAEACEAVGEIADGFVVVEVGLADPTLGPCAGDDEPALSVRLDGEAAVVDG